MFSPDAPEITVQERVIRYFTNQLHYVFLGNLAEQENQNIIPSLSAQYECL